MGKHHFIIIRAASVALLTTAGLPPLSADMAQAGDRSSPSGRNGGPSPVAVFAKHAAQGAGDIVGGMAATGAIGAGAAMGAASLTGPLLLGAGVAYKLADVAQDAGEAALDAQERFQDAKMIDRKYAFAVLKDVQRQGLDPSTDPRALEAKASLRATLESLRGRDMGSLPAGDLWAAILAHYDAAIIAVAWKQAMSFAIGRLFETSWVTRQLKNWLPRNWIAAAIAEAKPVLKQSPWPKIVHRGAWAKTATDELLKKLIEGTVEHSLSSGLADISRDLDSHFLDEIMGRHPSKPKITIIRLEIVRPRLKSLGDPVTQTIMTENTRLLRPYAGHNTDRIERSEPEPHETSRSESSTSHSGESSNSTAGYSPQLRQEIDNWGTRGSWDGNGHDLRSK